MSYINRNLLSNEDVMFRGHLSRVIFISPSLIVLVGLVVLALDGDIASIGLILLAAGLAGFLSAFVRYQTSEFAVTTRGSS